MQEIMAALRRTRVIPVIALNNVAHAAPLAHTLVENGLPCAEVTFRTENAAAVMAEMRRAEPDILLGAGTVLNFAQVNAALENSCDFIVAPGFNPEVVRYCNQRGAPMVPGINSPSQVEQAMGLGLNVVKFFPAELSGGVAMIKAMSAVYPVDFMPTGGIGAGNVSHYLKLPNVLACGGTWMVPKDALEAGDWDTVAALVREVVALVRSCSA